MQYKNDTNSMKFSPHYLIQVTLLLSLAFPILVNAATLTSTVNRNQISTNETLTLTVAIDEQVNSSELDLSPLQTNFEILDATPQSRSSFNIINGKSENKASTTWTITLVAKSEGVLTIPSFTVKSASSRPISIKVSNATQAAPRGRPLDVLVKSSAQEVYPNQQFIVEVELSAQSNVRDLSGAQLTIPNTDIEAFDQQNFQRVDNGIARQIVILKYSVFAKQSGEITIPVMTYTGLLNARRSVFGANGTQVIARSQPITVTVKDIPTDTSHAWFPADDVTITSTWSGDGAKLNVGEPITRTITITAKGQQASAIPPLEQIAFEVGLKSYKDQAQLQTSKSTQGFIATRVESEAIVANKAGHYVLPEIQLNWWNTKTKQWQTSTIEEQTLTATGTSVPVVLAEEQSISDTKRLSPEVNNSVHSNRLWQLVSAILALIVLLQFYLLIGKRKSETNVNSVKNKDESEQATWKALQVALKSDNSRAIRHSLVPWGRAILKSESSIRLEQLAKGEDSQELRLAFEALDKHLYKGEDKPNNIALAALLKKLRTSLLQSNGRAKKTKPELQPLYPKTL